MHGQADRQVHDQADDGRTNHKCDQRIVVAAERHGGQDKQNRREDGSRAGPPRADRGQQQRQHGSEPSREKPHRDC